CATEPMLEGTEIFLASSPVEDFRRSSVYRGAEPAFRGRWRPASRRCLAALIVSVCLFCMGPALAGGEIEFDIPAQPADKALILLGQQANEPVLYFYDDVQGKTSQAVNGT